MKNKITLNSILKYIQDNFSNFKYDSFNIDLPYLIAYEFSNYLIHCYKNNNIDELKKGLRFIEDMHKYGTEEVKELATIGYLETFQNNLSNDSDSKAIFNLLGKESKLWWEELTKFWN